MVPTVANSRPMLEEQAASLTTNEDFLLEQQQTLSRECAESVLTSNDLMENFVMSEDGKKFKYSTKELQVSVYSRH